MGFEFDEILKGIEEERSELRKKLIDSGQKDIVEAIEKAVDEAAVEHSNKLKPIIPKEPPKEVVPEQKEFTKSDHDIITQAMNGRMESDIPLNDKYWTIKNSINMRLV